MEHDSPMLLFRLECEYLISARVIRPGPVTVVKRVAAAAAGTTSAAIAERKLSLFKAVPSEEEWPGRS
jgi:hypothetical protein